MKRIHFTLAALMLTSASLFAQLPQSSMVSTAVANKLAEETNFTIAASLVNNAANISWTALKEVRRFELQKSADGNNFEYFSSFAGTGTNWIAQDANLFEGVTYYRLKIIGNDGNIRYSRMAAIDVRSSFEAVKLMPSSFKNQAFIWLPSNTTLQQLSVCDASGRTIKDHLAASYNGNIAIINSNELKAGNYLLKVVTNKGETLQLRYNKS